MSPLHVYWDGEEISASDQRYPLVLPDADRPAETDLTRIEWLLRGTRLDPVIDWIARKTGRIWFWYYNEQGKRRLYFDKPDVEL